MKYTWLSRIAGLIVLIQVCIPAMSYATIVPDSVLITEVQVRSGAAVGAANEEFVELYNTSDQPIDVSRWSLEYKSATGTSWTKKVTLHGSLAARSRYLLVSDKYTTLVDSITDKEGSAFDTFSSGLADGAGHVRIVSTDIAISTLVIVHDTLGWGSTADSAEGQAPATAPTAAKSLKRSVDSDGNLVDTDNNANDFTISSEPTPQADALYVPPPDPTPPPEEPTPDPDQTLPPDTEPEVEAPAPDPMPTPTPTPAEPEPPVTPSNLAPPQITELLPNPAPPATDSADEYIELYNPNDQPLDLTGYKLQTGNTFSYSHTFGATTLAANEYRAFYVPETGNILSNSGGKARLLDPSGTVSAETNTYDTADDGDSWVLVNGVWQWTITPTPNAVNVLVLPILKLATTKTPTPKKTATAKDKTPKASTAKVASAKTTKSPKASKAPKTAAAAAERQVYEDPEQIPASIHPTILVGVGAAALLYAVYEYRYDFQSRLQQFRRYRDVRRATRAASKG